MKNQRLNAQITIGGVLENSFKKNIGLIQSGFDKVGQSIKDVKARQKELSRSRTDLIKQGRSVEDLDREYDALGRTLDDLVAKQRRWERAARDSRRVGESFGRMTSNIGRLGRQVGAGIAAAGVGVFALASSTASYGDQVAKTAGKLGIGIEALQEFRYAAERSGVSAETFDSSLTAMQKRLGEAAQGTGAAKKALDQIGLSAKDLIKAGPEQALEQIAERMQGIENPAERAAIAAALFSRSGIGMVNVLGGGSDALQQLREDARKTGFVLSEQAARDAEAFADAQLNASLVVKGLKNTIGGELIPVVTRSMMAFSEWAVTNRKGVADFAETAATKIEAALPVIGQVAEGMGKVATTIGRVTAAVADMVGGWENFGIVVGSIFASRTITSVLKFGGSVGRLGASLLSVSGAAPLVVTGIKAIGRALLLNPIGLAVTAIAGGAFLIYENWDKIATWFTALWQDRIQPVMEKFGSTDGIVSAWQTVKDALGAVIDWLAEKFDWLMGKLQPVLDGLSWLKNKGAGAVEGIQGFGSSIGSNIRNFFSGDDPNSADPTQPGRSFLGGTIGRGFRHVGEQGPETIWTSKGGYVAHAAATERLAKMSAQAEPLIAALGGGLRNAVDRAQSMAMPAMRPAPVAAQPAPVVIHAQINAQHMTAAEIADELERRGRAAQTGALYDRAHDYGQYGG